MKTSIALAVALASGAVSAATVFHVNYDSSGIPDVSGPGADRIMASALSVNPPNETHVLGGGGLGDTLWINRYEPGDYFTFQVSGLLPDDRIALTGAWFGITRGPTGPTTVDLELWTSGSHQAGSVSGPPGVNLWQDLNFVSHSPIAELRLVGLGGTNDQFPLNESFGLDFIAFSFTVVPEPSSLLLSAINACAFFSVRRR